MEPKALIAGITSLIVAVIIGSFTAVRSYGNLETRLEYVAQEQIRVRATLDKIAADMDLTKSNRYTDEDARIENQRRDAQTRQWVAQLNELSKSVGRLIGQLARLQERTYNQERDTRSRAYEYDP